MFVVFLTHVMANLGLDVLQIFFSTMNFYVQYSIKPKLWSALSTDFSTCATYLNSSCPFGVALLRYLKFRTLLLVWFFLCVDFVSFFCANITVHTNGVYFLIR